MVESLLITFRETIEAALVIGIVISYLYKINQAQHTKTVYFGVFSGIALSVLFAVAFTALTMEFEGVLEAAFEGSMMLVGALLLSTMIFWMMQQENIADKIKQQVSEKISNAKIWGLFGIVFVAILREGVETVIFLKAVSFAGEGYHLLGASIGILAGILMGYAIFRTSLRIRLGTFFRVTNVFLILIAAGLVAHGIHEFQEVKLLPVYVEHLWNMNPAVEGANSYPIMHEEGAVGSVLKGVFGYNGNPSLLEVICYGGYLVVAGFIWRKIHLKTAMTQNKRSTSVS